MVVRLDGLAQVNDMLAIREMGRQISEEEGRMVDEEGEEEEEGEEVSTTECFLVVTAL